MENIKITSNKGNLIIEIPFDSIIAETNNEDWKFSHAIAPVSDKVAMEAYLVDILNEPTEDVGNGYVTKVELMIMDALEVAYEDGEEFFEEEDINDDNDEDDEE